MKKEEVPAALLPVVDETIIFIINGNKEGSGDTDRGGGGRGRCIIQCFSGSR